MASDMIETSRRQAGIKRLEVALSKLNFWKEPDEYDRTYAMLKELKR